MSATPHKECLTAFCYTPFMRYCLNKKQEGCILLEIIIVGCGKVGQMLVEQLNAEDNNITLIDIDAFKINAMVQKYDIMGVVGNGATYSTQMEAGIEQADLLIAVTKSDELNLLCCVVAKKAGKCQTIARIRNPEYSKDARYLQDELRLAMVINPEYAAAAEIARLLRFPSAIKIDTFAKGKAELLKFRIPENCILNGCALRELPSRLHCDILVCMIERGEEVIIPNGDITFCPNDRISIIAAPPNASKFFKKIHLFTNQIKNVIIVGGSSIAHYLSEMLVKSGISVKLIERDEKRCQELCTALPQITVIHGDGSDREILLEEGLVSTGAFVALTNFDEENMFLSLYARSQMNGKLITKVNRLQFDDIIRQLDLDSTVNPEFITAEYITQFIRAMKNASGSNVETLYTIMKGKVEAAEFSIKTHSPLVGVPLQHLRFRKHVLIAGIFRNGRMIIPRGQDTIEIGDSVVVVSRHLGLCDICDILDD